MDLEDYRDQIDRVNREIVDAVSRRMKVVDEIRKYKEENGVQTRDKEREEEVKQQFEKFFGKEELSKEKGRELAELLIEMAIEKQREA